MQQLAIHYKNHIWHNKLKATNGHFLTGFITAMSRLYKERLLAILQSDEVRKKRIESVVLLYQLKLIKMRA